MCVNTRQLQQQKQKRLPNINHVAVVVVVALVVMVLIVMFDVVPFFSELYMQHIFTHICWKETYSSLRIMRLNINTILKKFYNKKRTK